MTLHELFSLERGAQARLAQAMQVPAPMLSQWASGARPVPIERCVAIEVATDKKVTRKDLRPDDWEAIWPELALPPEAQRDNTARTRSTDDTAKAG